MIIPCFNDGDLVGPAIESATRGEPVEIVVVDDGSTDDATRQALNAVCSRGVTVLRQENRGLSAARMAGVASASARYVYNLDADDLAVASSLTQMADLLDANPDATVCYGDYEEFGDACLVRSVPAQIDAFRLAYINEYPVTALFRREKLISLGGWQHVGAGYEDWGLWMTLAERGSTGIYAGAGVITLRRRLHGPRMLGAAKSQHTALYRELRRRHPQLFSELARHRRASNLPLRRKLLYPLVYGGRRRFAFERHVKSWLDRHRLWTLQGGEPTGDPDQ